MTRPRTRVLIVDDEVIFCDLSRGDRPALLEKPAATRNVRRMRRGVKAVAGEPLV